MKCPKNRSYQKLEHPFSKNEPRKTLYIFLSILLIVLVITIIIGGSLFWIFQPINQPVVVNQTIFVNQSIVNECESNFGTCMNKSNCYFNAGQLVTPQSCEMISPCSSSPKSAST